MTRYRMLPLFCLVVLSLSGSACDAPARPEDTGQPRITQEGDDQTITFRSAALPSMVHDSAPARLRWTASGHDTLEGLGSARAAMELPDGRIAVLDGMSDVIHVLSAQGRLVTSWGGRGEGPQQFLAASRMFLSADSLIVVDQGGARASYVAPEGTVTRLLSPVQGLGAGIGLQGRTASGEWLGTRSRQGNSSTDGALDTLIGTIIVLDATGVVTDTLGEYVERLAVLRSSPEMQTMVKLPYSPSGSVRAAGTWVAYHSGVDFRVTLVDRGSGQRRIIQFDTLPPTLAANTRSQIVDAALDRVLADQRGIVEQLWQQAPWPAHEGGLIDVHPSRTGGVWIGVVDAPAATVGGSVGTEHWLHLDERGRPSPALKLGAREQLLAFGDSSAVVLARDGDGVQSIRVFSLSSNTVPAGN